MLDRSSKRGACLWSPYPDGYAGDQSRNQDPTLGNPTDLRAQLGSRGPERQQGQQQGRAPVESPVFALAARRAARAPDGEARQPDQRSGRAGAELRRVPRSAPQSRGLLRETSRSSPRGLGPAQATETHSSLALQSAPGESD